KNIIEAAGTIKANDSKNIVLDFSASVEDIPIEEGQRVKLGEELITLDIHAINQQILDMENDLKQAKLQLEVSMNDIDSAEKELLRQKNEYNTEKNNNTSIQLKENDYKNAQVGLNRVNGDLADQQSLFDVGGISEYDLELSKRKSEDAQKALNDKKLALDDSRTTRKQTLDKLQSGITQQTSNVNNLKLNIEIQNQKISKLESDLKQLKDKLNKSYLKGNNIISDYKNGLVQEIVPMEGDSIQPNTKLLNLVDMDSLVVDADVSEDFIKDVKVGAEVEILPLLDSGKQYKGHVLKIADMGIDKNGEIIIKTEISIDDIDDSIKPNFNVDVKISK
ncbi:MAG: HlyD family secretion protein, partial [Ruminiclostridium sp.]